MSAFDQERTRFRLMRLLSINQKGENGCIELSEARFQ
jgi:hypothetical protein